MTEFEEILQDCLLDLELGDYTVDDCLNRHPGHALQLEPILLTSLELEHGREARPSAAFKARIRARLTQEMRAHPRKSIQFRFLFMRMATSFAVVLFALLAVGTAYAQNALPGSPFYAWKLMSENVWRSVSPDPVGTDLVIAQRRADELLAVGNDPALRAQILDAYLEVVARLESEMSAENEAQIRSILDSQTEELNQSEVLPLPVEQDVVPEPMEPTALPTEIPQLNPTLPIPTTEPELVPTASSVLVPTAVPVKPTALPKIVPTVKVPPLLP